MSTGSWLEAAFREAVEQMALRRHRRDHWSSRVVFWAAVRFEARAELRSEAWPAAAERWASLLAEAGQEHLPPIPGQPEADNLGRHATRAERALAGMRDIVARRR